MKKFVAILMVIASIPFYTVGLLFLIAAAMPDKSSRALPGFLLAAIATVLLVAGLKQLRRLATINPEALKTEAVELAQRLGGELTPAQLRAEYRISQPLAVSTLEKLVGEGTAVREQREERVVYVFTGFKAAVVEKNCPYCGTKLPVRSALRKCPNCGAQLEITKT
jgi:hypothetical protein